MRQAYLVALGSNLRHPALGAPHAVVTAAIDALGELGDVTERSDIILTRPIGPSQRCYANAAAVLESGQQPEKILADLLEIERRFGRRRQGQGWRARVLDLDLVLWSGGSWASPRLTIPHPHMHERPFVLGPAAQIAGGWRDPITNLSLNHLFARLTRPRPAPR